MTLTTKFKQQLKAKAHPLKPIVFIGNNGLTANIITDIDRGLSDHELIKIRIQCEDRETKRALFAEVCEATQAQAVQLIGSIAVLYRLNPPAN